MNNFEWTHIVTCKTEGCSAYNIELPQILMPYSYFDLDNEIWVPILDENGNEQFSCTCGPCGIQIEDVIPVG